MPLRRRASIETKINHERWLVSYADFITLLFAFFVVMYSVSQVNENKYRRLSHTLQAAFKQDSVEVAESNLRELADLDELKQSFQQALASSALEGEIKIGGNEDWVELELNANVLFASGSAEPSDEARQVFSDVANILEPFENAVAVAGHTDNVPIRNARYENNWELSAARAVAVVNLLAYDGVDPKQLSAIGYGEFQPIADNSTEAGRASNRRVVLRVARERAELPQQGAEMVMSEAGVAPDEAETGNSETPSELPVEELESAIKPITLPNGGLLFTSDPKGRGE